MRNFEIYRDTDGQHGVQPGRLAEGTLFNEHLAVVHWFEDDGIRIYTNNAARRVQALQRRGSTKLEWLNEVD